MSELCCCGHIKEMHTEDGECMGCVEDKRDIRCDSFKLKKEGKGMKSEQEIRKEIEILRGQMLRNNVLGTSFHKILNDLIEHRIEVLNWVLGEQE